MYSFLDDKELYGAPLVASAPPTVPASGAVMQGGVHPSGARRAPPPVASPPAEQDPGVLPVSLEVFLKTIAHLEKRLLALEEKVLLSTQRMEQQVKEVGLAHAKRSDVNWWGFALSIALAVGLSVLLMRSFGRQPALSEPLPQAPQVVVPLQAPLPQAASGMPPTPVYLMTAPQTFLSALPKT